MAMPLAAVTLAGLGAAPRLAGTRQVVIVAALGILSFLASAAYARGLRALPASRASLLAMIEPVGAAVLAGILFGERFGRLGVLGAALALAGIVVPPLWPRRRGTAGLP